MTRFVSTCLCCARIVEGGARVTRGVCRLRGYKVCSRGMQTNSIRGTTSAASDREHIKKVKGQPTLRGCVSRINETQGKKGPPPVRDVQLSSMSWAPSIRIATLPELRHTYNVFYGRKAVSGQNQVYHLLRYGWMTVIN